MTKNSLHRAGGRRAFLGTSAGRASSPRPALLSMLWPFFGAPQELEGIKVRNISFPFS